MFSYFFDKSYEIKGNLVLTWRHLFGSAKIARSKSAVVDFGFQVQHSKNRRIVVILKGYWKILMHACSRNSMKQPWRKTIWLTKCKKKTILTTRAFVYPFFYLTLGRQSLESTFPDIFLLRTNQNRDQWGLNILGILPNKKPFTFVTWELILYLP